MMVDDRVLITPHHLITTIEDAIMATTKQCIKCNTIKPLDEYYIDWSAPHRTSGDCKACRKARTLRFKRANPDKVKEYRKKERIPLALRAVRRLANPAAMTRSRLNKKAFKRSNDQARFMQRTPRHWAGWREMREQILDIYMDSTELAWTLGFHMPVDHIVPLNGTNVSGLHVPSNLRIMTAEANELKGAEYTP